MHHLPGSGDARNDGFASRPFISMLLQKFDIGGHGAMDRVNLPGIAVVPIHKSEFRLAYAHCIVQHRLEDGLEAARRTGDDAETSDVAVCCSKDSLRSAVSWRNSR